MNIKRLTAVAVMSIAAIGITAGTADAQPAALTAVNGTDHGIGYHTLLSDAGKAVTTTVDAGAFSLSKTASTVTLTNGSGATVAQIPLVFQVSGKEVSLAPAITDAGRSLTLTPDVSPVSGQAKDIGSQQWFMSELQHASTGAAVGAVIGAVIGFFFFGVGIIPGALIGAGIGLLVAGGQPLIDSGLAYFGGQP